MGQSVELRIAKRVHEDYAIKTKPSLKPFTGSGQRLGAYVFNKKTFIDQFVLIK